MRLAAIAAAVWLSALPNALAQSNDWLVLPTTVEDGALWMGPTVHKLNRELRRYGVGAWSSNPAASAFQQRGSAPLPTVSESAVQAWAARAQKAVRALARGNYAAGLSELDEALAFSESKLATLNRDPARAQQVLDICLYLVRARVDMGDEQGARQQARVCVQIAPSVAPSTLMHPPTVLKRYEEALTRGPSNVSTLLVESEPSGCALRVNGILSGRTPKQLIDLYPGRYQVQVECDEETPGRMHTVEVPRGSARMFVYDRFDRSVRTAPFLHLRYDAVPEPQRLLRDAREVARVLPASAVVVASAPGPELLELRLVTGAQENTAIARVNMSISGPSDDALAQATEALLAGECVDLTDDEPIEIDCRTGAPIVVTRADRLDSRAKGKRPPRGQFVSGVTLASVGVASLLGGYGLLIGRRAAGDDWLANPGSLDAHNKWLRLGSGVIVAGSVGSGLLVTAMPLVLPYKRKTPWWAWLTGGFGLGFAAASIATGVTADPKPALSCSINNLNPEPCTNRAKQTDLALMLGFTAAPLLTMPLVYLFRKSDKKLAAELSPRISITRSGGIFGVNGAF